MSSSSSISPSAIKKDESTTTHNKPQFDNVESIFKPPSSSSATEGTARKSPPRFLGKRNKNSSFDNGNVGIKKRLSWALPHDQLHTDYDIDKLASSVAASTSNPTRSPTIDDGDYPFPIKFSLSQEYKDDDASFSEYLKEANFSMEGSSPTGSPLAFTDANNMMFLPSPSFQLQGSDTFDYAEHITGVSTSNLPKMSPLTTPRTKLLESPPTIKNTQSINGTGDGNSLLPPPRFPMELIHSSRHDSSGQLSPRKPSSSPQTQHLSPGQTIYNVASKSVGSPETPYYDQQPMQWRPGASHSTPKNASDEEEAPVSFSPPRGNIPKSSRHKTTIAVSTSHEDKEESLNDGKHTTTPSTNRMLGGPITPSPSQIRTAVSDESSSPTLAAPTVHHPPPQAHHVPPSGPWNQAPLPPYVPSQQFARGGGPWGQNLPPALPSSGSARPYYSPYYHQAHQSQAIPDRAISGTDQVQENASEQAYWRKHHTLLHQFLMQFGHCNVPEGYGKGTHYEKLHQWCADQRTEYQKMCRRDSISRPSTMTPNRVRILTSMGFVWGSYSNNNTFRGSISNNVSYSSWDKWIEVLKEYKDKHGDVDVPLKYSGNQSLGMFVNRQRSEYRKYQAGKSTSMTPERIKDLNELGFTWTARDAQTSWDNRYAELREFHNVNGHANVPKIYTKNPSLGYWVNEQRFQYRRMSKKKSTYLTAEKIRLLNKINFKWSLRESNGSWDNWIKELRDYKSQHGDVDVPLKYKHNPALGAFVNRQRTEWRKLQKGVQTSLSPERIASLDELSFKWTIRVSRTPWETRLNELKKFKEIHGHCNVPSTYPKNQPLAYWVFKQRGQYRIFQKRDYVVPGEKKQVCHMTLQRIRALDELGFEWSPPRRLK